jgi:6-phosphogluconolactonase
MSIELLLGTYTRRVSDGIYTIELNTETQALENLSLLAKVGSPTYLDTNEDKSIIYTIVNENDEGGIASLVKQADGTYTRKDQVMAAGAPPCYVAYDKNRELVYTANYHKGEVAVYKTDAEGNLELTDVDAHSGSSVHENQDAPHAHYTNLTPDEKYMVACDLGTDEVYTYEVNAEGKLTEVARLEVAPGTGPRHLVFHPTLDIAYIFGELSSDVVVVSYDADTGKFEILQTISTIPADHTSFNGGAAIRISSDGKFVYASNRGHDSLAIFETDTDGKLTLVNYTPTEGETPRDFNLDPSEKYVIVGHQDSDNLTLFERNAEDGTLTLLEKDVEAPEVVCIAHG